MDDPARSVGQIIGALLLLLAAGLITGGLARLCRLDRRWQFGAAMLGVAGCEAMLLSASFTPTYIIAAVGAMLFFLWRLKPYNQD